MNFTREGHTSLHFPPDHEIMASWHVENVGSAPIVMFSGTGPGADAWPSTAAREPKKKTSVGRRVSMAYCIGRCVAK